MQSFFMLISLATIQFLVLKTRTWNLSSSSQKCNMLQIMMLSVKASIVQGLESWCATPPGPGLVALALHDLPCSAGSANPQVGEGRDCITLCALLFISSSLLYCLSRDYMRQKQVCKEIPRAVFKTSCNVSYSVIYALLLAVRKI